MAAASGARDATTYVRTWVSASDATRIQYRARYRDSIYVRGIDSTVRHPGVKTPINNDLLNPKYFLAHFSFVHFASTGYWIVRAPLPSSLTDNNQ